MHMKRNVLAVIAAGAIALGGFAIVQAQPGQGGAGCGHGHAFGLQHLTDKLNLTSDQQTKVQPILDQAKPQIVAIHQEAMQKMKAVMDSTLSQIRPLLNEDQQKKVDAIQKAHQDITLVVQIEIAEIKKGFVGWRCSARAGFYGSLLPSNARRGGG